MGKKLKKAVMVLVAVFALVTVASTIVNNSEFVTCGYVNIDDENDKVEKQLLEEFIQTHHTPFSKTIIKNDD